METDADGSLALYVRERAVDDAATDGGFELRSQLIEVNE